MYWRTSPWKLCRVGGQSLHSFWIDEGERGARRMMKKKNAAVRWRRRPRDAGPGTTSASATLTVRTDGGPPVLLLIGAGSYGRCMAVAFVAAWRSGA